MTPKLPPGNNPGKVRIVEGDWTPEFRANLIEHLRSKGVQLRLYVLSDVSPGKVGLAFDLHNDGRDLALYVHTHAHGLQLAREVAEWGPNPKLVPT